MEFDLQPRLDGDLLALRPLTVTDYQALFSVASDPEIWKQHPVSNRYEESAFRSFFIESIASGGALIAIHKDTSDIIGSTRYHGYDEAAAEIEIGWTFLARKYWGGRYNGEMKKLMFDHAFQFVESVVLLVSPDNIRSQCAVEKVGGRREGVRNDGLGITSYLYRVYRS